MIAAGNVSTVLRIGFVACLVATSIPVGSLAQAASGDLDVTFGDDGTETTVFPGGSFARAVAVDADGAIVAVGAAAGPSGRGEFAVARYLDNGTLDETFGDRGMVTTPVSAGGDEARSVALTSGGKIVVAGTAGREPFAVARYRANGSLDAAFSSDGVARTELSAGDDIAYDVAIQSDGRIVAAGSSGSRRPVFALVRYRKDGRRDHSFGDGGKVLTPFGIWGVGRALAIQPNGRILLAGFDGEGFGLARYLPDGRLDPSFGDGGRVVGSFPYGYALAVALEPDGRFVAAGSADIFRFGIARYRRNGTLDRTFGSHGRVVLQVGRGEQGVAGLVIQPGGKIVAVGHAGPHESTDDIVWRFELARLRPDGSLDPTFGGDGRVTTHFAGGAFAAGVALDLEGRLVVAGGVGDANAEGFALARYLP